MSLKTKNIILLGITALWAVLIIIPIFLPSQGGKKISPAMVLPPLPPKARTAGEEGAILPSPAARPVSLDEARGRDPFSLPSGVQPAGAEGRESLPGESVKETRLTAILRRGKTALATINGQVVQEGDIINGAKVIKIGKDSVILSAGDGGRTTLKLYENLPAVAVTDPKEGGI